MTMTLKAGAMIGFLTVASGEARADLWIETFDAEAQQRWSYVQDGVMGGVSEGDLTFEEADGASFARLKGRVSTDNNGGFIQFRAGIRGGLPSETEALRLRVKGNGESYYVFIRTTDRKRPWHSYRARFTATEDWRVVDLDLASFTASHAELPQTFTPENITGIGFVAYGRDFYADLLVSDLGLVMAQ